jgi:hypothetical protein
VAWDVEYTDEFETWWNALNEDEQESVAASVGLLEERGPQLPHPYSSDVKTSRHGQMENCECNITGARIGCCMHLIHGVSAFFFWAEIKLEILVGTRSTYHRLTRSMIATWQS